VAIVGRPNVGKSSLFNRLLRRRQAVVDRIPGVTRDRLHARLAWRGRSLLLVDTGGLVFEQGSSLNTAIQEQVTAAIVEADLLLFLGDAVSGPLPLDARVAERLRTAGKPVLVVINKADTELLAGRAVEFHALGLGPPLTVSSSHGRGVGDLLDAIVAALPRDGEEAPAPRTDVALAIVGRPNVGKSSLLNRLVRAERVTVDAVPGTTRDAVDVWITRGEETICLVDTAGVRARPKLKTLVDVVSVKRSLAAIERADACLFIVDAADGLLNDDLTLLGLILKVGRPCIIVLNKWDLLEAGDPEAYAQAVWRRAPFARFLPVIATSAVTGYQIEEALALAAEVARRGRQPISVDALGDATHRLREGTDRPGKLRQVRVVRVRQVSQRPLTVELAIHGTVRLHRPELAFVERILRSTLDLDGVPILISVRRV